MKFSKTLKVKHTPIPGVLLFDIPVYGDNRGWFKENWQVEKMRAAGLPDFGPVQNNISFNESTGTTRGIHAEPWDKFISVATGSVFGAWVDLRQGPSYGTVFTAVLDPSVAIYIPRGVGNAFQTLEDATAYTYLVNDHWSSSAQDNYTFLNLADKTANIPWPIPLDDAEVSEKDRNHPQLIDVVPMKNRKILVLGGNGQLGRALRAHYAGNPDVEFATRETIDMSAVDAFAGVSWTDYHTVINAAAFTKVDAAETIEGRAAAWKVNVTATAALARECTTHKITLVHVSSDYVFDGTHQSHEENEPFTPLSVYGQTKAAGDALVSTVPKHYIVRTSWVIGDGNNFVSTMASLAQRGISPKVVDDQFGRLTFTQDLASAIDHLVTNKADYGTYNMSNSGPVQSWAEIAAEVYEILGLSRDKVCGTSTTQYSAGKSTAWRPPHSSLNLRKITDSGYEPIPVITRLHQYLDTITRSD